MSKRLTKAQREEAELAHLRQRVTDIYQGAIGGAWNDGDYATVENLSKLLPALQAVFGINPEAMHVWGLWNLDEFDNPEKAARYLFEHGYRADSFFEARKP